MRTDIQIFRSRSTHCGFNTSSNFNTILPLINIPLWISVCGHSVFFCICSCIWRFFNNRTPYISTSPINDIETVDILQFYSCTISCSACTFIDTSMIMNTTASQVSWNESFAIMIFECYIFMRNIMIVIRKYIITKLLWNKRAQLVKIKTDDCPKAIHRNRIAIWFAFQFQSKL